MPTDCRLLRLDIVDFRGLRQLTLDLPALSSMYLIGGNNAGKSTALNALAFVLKGGGFHLFHPEPFDYFHDANGGIAKTFSITLGLAAREGCELPAVQGVGNPIPVHGIRVEGKTAKTGLLSHQHVLLDADGDAIVYSSRTPLKGEAKEKYEDQGLGYRRHYARLDEIRDYVPEVWLLSPDNLYRSLYEWKTGPLQKLAQMLTKRFLADSWTMKSGPELRPMPETIYKVHDFFRDAVAAFPFWKDDLKPRLEGALGQYVGHQARIALVPDIRTLEEWLAQQLSASFAADAGGPLTPLKNMGQGWQSLVRIAALDVISQYPDQMRERVVLLFEEPETYLHPHLSRKLRTVLERLAAQGWYVLCATHAPEFIDFSAKQHVVRMWRQGDDVVSGALMTEDIGEEAKFQERLDEHGTHEMLFCQRLVICEGKDDEYAVHLYLQKAGVDLHGRSVSIIGVGGVENIPDYAGIACSLGIPWFAITDEDPESGGIRRKTRAVRDRLASLAGAMDRSEFWPVGLESCLGLLDGRKAKPEWQRRNIEPKDLAAIMRDHGDFNRIGESIRTWVESPAAIAPSPNAGVTPRPLQSPADQ